MSEVKQNTQAKIRILDIVFLLAISGYVILVSSVILKWQDINTWIPVSGMAYSGFAFFCAKHRYPKRKNAAKFWLYFLPLSLAGYSIIYYIFHIRKNTNNAKGI